MSFIYTKQLNLYIVLNTSIYVIVYEKIKLYLFPSLRLEL
jgi:hypothetical protein